MPITFVGIGRVLSTTAVTTLPAITIPAGSVGDLLLGYATNGAVVAFNAESGWTPVDALASTINGTTALGAWYRIATGSDTNPTFGWSTTTNPGVGVVLRYGGVDTSVLPTAANRHGYAMHVSPAATNASMTSVAPPDLSAATPWDLIVNCWALGQVTRTGGTNTGGPITGSAGALGFNGAPMGWAQRGNNITGDALSTGSTRATGNSKWNNGMVLADRLFADEYPTVTSFDETALSGGQGLWIAHSIALKALVPPNLNPGEMMACAT